ncbi:MAG: shikimate kinase [Candidatus Riflebacteria bacterium]|nr:shikimate kinase [Candidatus Riflebacteria bacterium]
MNLVLVGYRGTGKTAVGRAVASRLDMRYVGLDELIVRQAGRSIPRIVEQSGWDAFRDLEARVVAEVAGLDRCVLDTGGGVVLRPVNVELLRSNGFVVWLVASVSVIVGRIQGDTERPSLTGGKSFTDEVEEVLRARTAMYRAAADQIVDSSGCSLEEVVDLIERSFVHRLTVQDGARRP